MGKKPALETASLVSFPSSSVPLYKELKMESTLPTGVTLGSSCDVSVQNADLSTKGKTTQLQCSGPTGVSGEAADLCKSASPAAVALNLTVSKVIQVSLPSSLITSQHEGGISLPLHHQWLLSQFFLHTLPAYSLCPFATTIVLLLLFFLSIGCLVSSHFYSIF